MGTPQHGKSLLIPWTCPACNEHHSWEWEELDEPFVDHPIEMQCDHCGTTTKMTYAGRVSVTDTTSNTDLDRQLAAHVAERDTELAEPALEDPTPDPTPKPTQPEHDPGDPYQRALDRLQLTPKLQGADQAGRFLRALSLKLQPFDATGDVGARLREIANLLESAA
jgi:hypothetical protein